MKAIVKSRNEKGLWLQDVEMPQVGERDLLLKVKKTSICGTDLHIYDWDKWAQKTVKVPTILGHEFCGEVVEVGKAVKGFKVSDRVAGEGHITCGHCRNCRTDKRHLCNHITGVGITRDGAFAEYVSIPADNAFLLPDEINDETASILDPLGNAIHTALAYSLSGEDVLITGAGPIGLMATAVARFVGARKVLVSDLNDYRLEMAKKMGATHTVHVGKESLEEVIKTMGMDEGIDVGLEMSGNPKALQSIIEVIRPGSPICLLGILPEDASIDWQKVIFKGLVLKGIYGRKMFETWYKMSGLLSGGLNVAPILTHRYHFEDFEKGFEAMASGKCGKVVLSWDG